MTEPKTTEAGERTQHTPGPWTIMFDHPDPETAPAIGYIRAEADAGRDGLEIATIYGCDQTSYYAETHRADARLIAAAPELLEAMREMVAEARERNRAAGETVFNPAALAIALAAIAKAEGRA